VYVIKKGDNPWTIARKLKIDYQKLLEINQITNPRDLKIGQKLKLPKSL
jgi:LysM repeat protein